jgi:hypothetical protein
MFALIDLLSVRKLRTVGKKSAGILIFATLLLTTVGMHTRHSAPLDELSFAGRKHLSLVIAVHPGCPTSRKMLTEAIRISYRVPGEVKVTALIFSPDDEKIDADANSNLLPLTRIKAKILTDRNGEIARNLGITNSAQALLFSPNGKVLYNGGITPNSRSNPGEETVVEIINGSDINPLWAPPHGCSLQGYCEHEHGLKTAASL